MKKNNEPEKMNQLKEIDITLFILVICYVIFILLNFNNLFDREKAYFIFYQIFIDRDGT